MKLADSTGIIKQRKLTVLLRHEYKKQEVWGMDLHKAYERMEGMFAKIDNTELFLHAECFLSCNEFEEFEYEFDYRDECGIGKIYEESAALMRECVSHGIYRQALHLFALMVHTKIFVRAEQCRFLDLNGMIEEKLVAEDLDELYNYACYAVYCTAKKEQRVQAVYQVMSGKADDSGLSYNHKYMDFSGLPELAPLADMQEFWASWLGFLRKEAGQGNKKACQMLEKSVLNCKQADEMIKQARLEKTKPFFLGYGRAWGRKTYLELYLEAMDAIPCSDYGKKIAVGEEALGLEKYRQSIQCSEIAFRIAHAAACAGNENKAGHFYELAFFLDMVPKNYLAAYRMSPQPELFCRHASERIKNLPKELREDNRSCWIGGGWNSYTESGRIYTKENRIVLLFLNGEMKLFAEYYSEALQICRNRADMRGKEKIITEFALLSLLLFKERTWKEGCRFMAEFLAKDWFRQGFVWLGKQAGKGEEANVTFFHECFQHWKDRQQLLEEARQQYVLYLENWLDAYIEMAAKNFHADFKLLAAVIAAFGEVKESMGETDGKQKAFARYQDRFCACMNRGNQTAREEGWAEWFPYRQEDEAVRYKKALAAWTKDRQEDNAVLYKKALAAWMKYFGMQPCNTIS